MARKNKTIEVCVGVGTDQLTPEYVTVEIPQQTKPAPKFQVGDRAHKPKGYAFPCTIVGVFETLKGETRVIGEMDEYGLLHIFNETQLEHYEY
jgi:hypothetical protein